MTATSCASATGRSVVISDFTPAVERLHGIPVGGVAEMYGGDVRIADSTIQAAGGHYLHVEGGAEIMWRQVGHLTMALQEMCDQVDFLRSYVCKCGEPAAKHHDAATPSPFLKHVIRQETP